MKQKLIISSLVLILFFLSLCAFWNAPLFVSDEEEIFVKGQQIASGEMLYKDIASQHMPIMYFFAALFSRLGINSIVGFRLCFYCIIACIWTIIYVVYEPRFGKYVTIGYPIVFLCCIANIAYAKSIISEQIQSQALVIVLLEMILYWESKGSIKWKNCFMISFAIFLSIGVAFVSIFPLFVAALSFIIIDIKRIVDDKKRTSVVKSCLRKYIKLLICIIIPWAGLLVYFYITNTINDFYSWAYQLNREVYPKYTGGYGSSILGGLFGGISSFGKSIDVSEGLSLLTVRTLSIISLALLFLRNIYKNTSRLLSVFLFFFLIGTATRGAFDNFHGLPAVAITCVMAISYSKQLIPKIKEIPYNKVASIVIIFILSSGYISYLGNVFTISPEWRSPNTTENYYQRKLESVIDNIAEDGEEIGFSLLNYDILPNSNVLPASITGGSCPWIWEWGRKKAMNELRTNPPRLFLFDDTLSTWGYPILEYAHDLAMFINQNYKRITEIGGLDRLYIRNDIFADVSSLIYDAQVFNTLGINPTSMKIEKHDIIEQRFVSKVDATTRSIQIKVGSTVHDKNTIKYELVDCTSRMIICNGIHEWNSTEDGLYEEITSEPIRIHAGHQYSLKLSIDNPDDADCIILYNDGGYASEESCCIWNGKKQDFNLMIYIASTG